MAPRGGKLHRLWGQAAELGTWLAKPARLLPRKLRNRWQVAVTAVAPFVALGTLATSAAAQTGTAADTQPATIDTGRGPLTGSTRFIGMSGAFVAIAEDTEGVAINPASTALRLRYSWSEWDYGLGIDFAIGAWLPKNNFYNQPGSNQDVKNSTALFGSIAADLNYRHFGVGVSAEAQRNAATRTDQTVGVSTSLAANYGIVHANAAYGFYDGQLLLGAGPRFVGVSFNRSSGSSSPFSSAGVGYEAGVVVKPAAAQYRVGVSVRSPVDAKVPGENGAPASTIHVPWELAFGGAYQFGRVPLNPRWVSAKDIALETTHGREPTKEELKSAEDELFDRYERAERFYFLISGELSVLERTRGEGNFDQYWSQVEHQPISGVVLSPRIGAETEVIPHWLRLRGGTYYEAPLIGGVTGRFHGTGGFDVRLFEWNVFGLIEPFDYWRLSLAADAARQYLNTSINIGFWH